SDRVAGVREADGNPAGYDVRLKTDEERLGAVYMRYQDYNGFYQIASSENKQVGFQGDYGLVRFSYKTGSGQPYAGQSLYVLGQFNQYRRDENSRMVYNAATGVYEKILLLKQGFYSYLYGASEAPQDVVQSD